MFSRNHGTELKQKYGCFAFVTKLAMHWNTRSFTSLYFGYAIPHLNISFLLRLVNQKEQERRECTTEWKKSVKKTRLENGKYNVTNVWNFERVRDARVRSSRARREIETERRLSNLLPSPLLTLAIHTHTPSPSSLLKPNSLNHSPLELYPPIYLLIPVPSSPPLTLPWNVSRFSPPFVTLSFSLSLLSLFLWPPSTLPLLFPFHIPFATASIREWFLV